MGESGQKVQTPSYKINKSRGYHGLTVTIINNTLSYLKAAKSKKILITRKSICNCIQWQMLIQIIMVSISQYIRETQVQSLSREDPLEKWMAAHSSILAWKYPWTEEPGGLQSMGSQRVRHDWATNTHIHTIHIIIIPFTFKHGGINTCFVIILY